jgi:acetyl esterase/lipase
MASWQAHALDLAVRFTVKRKLKNQTDLAVVRQILGRGELPAPKDVTYVPESVAGVAGEWVRAPGLAADAPVLVYLHGGGYFACSPRTHRPVTGYFARAGFAVFVPDYRLAPEHPFPAAIDDAEQVYRALLASGHAPSRLVLAGDSAGGGLAVALMLRLRDAAQALPAAAVLFSPWTDLAGTGASVQENAKNDAMFWAPGILAGASFYLADTDAKNPLASPVYADLRGLPQLLIHAGAREILRDDSTRLAENARAAGVQVELRIWDVVPHVWQLANPYVPEAAESLSIAAAFLHDAVSRPPADAVAAEADTAGATAA